MDLNDIWQQHKNWILGLVTGLVLFLIGSSLISSRFDTGGLRSKISRANKKLQGQLYDRQALNAARKEREALGERLARLEMRLKFQARPEFVLEGQGKDPAVYYLELEGQTKGRLRNDLEALGVEYTATDLGMPSEAPVGREDKQLVLHGLDLVADGLDRLMSASGLATTQRPEAHGLRSVESIKMKTGAREAGRGARRSRRSSEVDLGTRVETSMRFRCDSLTLQHFLEQTLGNEEHRPLLIANLSIKDVGESPGQPLLVQCDLLALIPEN